MGALYVPGASLDLIFKSLSHFRRICLIETKGGTPNQLLMIQKTLSSNEKLEPQDTQTTSKS